MMTEKQHTLTLPFENSYAFIIGINNYTHLSPLTTANQDAKALANALTTEHAYIVPSPLIDATKIEIETLFNKTIPSLVKEDDRLIIYFAGHGIALDSDDNPKGYIVPVDAIPGDTSSLVSMDLVQQTINELKCKHGLLILDCCFAGAFKWSTGFRDVVFDLPGIIYEERFYQYARDPAWQVITSSASDQKAVDILNNRSLGLRDEHNLKHSPFASALLDGLAGEADTIPKDREDGVITATELYTYLRDRVEDATTAIGKRQSPSIFSLKKHDKGQYIFLHPRHPLNLPPIPDRNPYMGLLSYNEQDASLFYGRDRVIESLLDKIQKNAFVVVSGASGTGKSSVIKAGLIPNLRKAGWQILPVIRPGKFPLQTLDVHFQNLPSQLKDGQNTILLIDQYEELITQCKDPNSKNAFEATLSEWLQQFNHLHIIISIRSDFEPQLEKGSLEKWWKKGRYVVPAFNQNELKEIIIKPTVQEVLFFDPKHLVGHLIDAINQAPGALPLLSFTLSELYYAYLKSGRTNRALTLEDYEKLGGVIGALQNRANEIFDNLSQAHQSSMQKLMLRMVSLESGELASKRVYINELSFSGQEETENIRKIANQLVDARLITTGVNEQNDAYFEPAHDALIRSWARLWEWIRITGEEKLGLTVKLGLAATDYFLAGNTKKAQGLLWHDDPRLTLADTILQSKNHLFNLQEATFIKKSISLRNRRRNRRRFWVTSAMITLSMLSSVAIFQSIRANKEAQTAITKTIEAQDSAKVAQEQRAYALQQSIQAEASARDAFFQKGIADSTAEVAITQKNLAEQEALNAKLSRYLAEVRYNAERHPQLAFQIAEKGYKLAKANQVSVMPFKNQIIKIIYNFIPFPQPEQAHYKADTFDLSNTSKFYKLQTQLREMIETNNNGDTVHRYDLGWSYPVSLRYSPNGSFIISEDEPEGGEVGGYSYSLFKRNGTKFDSIYARHYMATFNTCPYFFDEDDTRLVALNDDFNLETYSIIDDHVHFEAILEGFKNNTSAIALSPSGQYLAIASAKGEIMIYKYDQGEIGRYADVKRISRYIAHPKQIINHLIFFNNETILQTKTKNQIKYWTIESSIHFEVGFNDGAKIDPVTNESIFSSQSSYDYDLNHVGLNTNDGEELVHLGYLPNGDNDNFISYFCNNGDYFFANGYIYPIKPELILDRVYKHKIFGDVKRLKLPED